jgi:membrane-associated phospholipid phosphatase
MTVTSRASDGVEARFGKYERVTVGRPTALVCDRATSQSMPSGHSASAFAFATAVGYALPALSVPLHAAATAVAYSRVHTGVHYPADAIAGSVIGTSVAAVVAAYDRS